MYYKITNQQCDIYRKLREQRVKELLAKEENRVLLEQKIPYQYKRFRGLSDQGARRIPVPMGFYFLQPSEVDLSVWREEKAIPGLYVPNKRKKVGRDIEKFLNSLQSFSAFKLLNVIGIDFQGEFRTPFLELVGDVLLLYLDDDHSPKDENVVEITRKEFNAILEIINVEVV